MIEGLFINYRVCKAYGLGYVSGSIYCALHYLTRKGITQISTSFLKEFVLECTNSYFYKCISSLENQGLIVIIPIHKGLHTYTVLDPKKMFRVKTSSTQETISSTQETISSTGETISKEKKQKKNNIINIRDKNDGGDMPPSTTTTTDSSLIYKGIPTLEIIKRFGEMNPEIPEHVLLQFFHRYEMIGWVYNGRAIRNWKYPWERFYESWIKYKKKDDERAATEQTKQANSQPNQPKESDWERHERKKREAAAQDAYLAAHPEEKPVNYEEFERLKRKKQGKIT